MNRYRDDPKLIRSLMRGGEVHRDVYIDPELFDLEMRALVAHGLGLRGP